MAVFEVHAPIAIRPLTAADVRQARRLERAAYGSSSPRTPFERELRNGLASYLVAVAVAHGDAVGSVGPADGAREAVGSVAQSDAGACVTPAYGEGSSGESGVGPSKGLIGWLRRLFAPAEEGPPVLGFAGVWYTHEQLHLVTIAVDPEQQGRGIGQALVLAVCDLAIEAGLDSIALEVRDSNARALRLYEHFGFRRGGRLRAYYSDNGEDAVVMLLDGLAAREEPAALARARASHAQRHGDRFEALRRS